MYGKRGQADGENQWGVKRVRKGTSAGGEPRRGLKSKRMISGERRRKQGDGERSGIGDGGACDGRSEVRSDGRGGM